MSETTKKDARPSSAGACQVCGKHVGTRYGGEGRYKVVCVDCWLSGIKREAQPSTRG